MAVSTDTREGAERTEADLGLTFPVGYGLPLHDTAERFGLYFEARRKILHAAAFLLGPDRRIEVVAMSSGAVGRLQPEETLRLIEFWQGQGR